MKPFFALLAEMGTGKTWIIINNFCDLYRAGKCAHLFVVAPNGVHANWILKEIPAHMQEGVPCHSVGWKLGDEKTLYSAPSGVTIFAMNWEALQTKKGEEAAKTYCKWAEKNGGLMIACDESDAAKNPSANRTKALMKLGDHAAYRRIMTGTMINNSPFDAFSQYSFLSPTILKTQSFYAFKSEYGVMLDPFSPLVQNIRAKSNGRGVPQVVARDSNGRPMYKNLERLHKLIAPHSFRVLKKDCLDLPEKIYETVYFDMTAEQWKAYRQAQTECRLILDDGNVAVFTKLVALGKLAQITSCYYHHPFSDLPERIPGKNPKLEILINRVTAIVDQGSKVIVWARYTSEIHDIVAALKAVEIESVVYNGETKEKDRINGIDAFQDGDVPVFVGNQQAGGAGLTLTAATYMIYYSNSFSLRSRLQSEDRAHRIGQRSNVTYIDLVARGTIDEKIVEALEAKQEIAELIVDRKIVDE